MRCVYESNRSTAVLGLHAINEEAVVINGKIEIRPVGTTNHSANYDANENIDDVPGSYLRSPTFGWTGSCDFPGQGM